MGERVVKNPSPSAFGCHLSRRARLFVTAHRSFVRRRVTRVVVGADPYRVSASLFVIADLDSRGAVAVLKFIFSTNRISLQKKY